jgi:hypothetical protein
MKEDVASFQENKNIYTGETREKEREKEKRREIIKNTVNFFYLLIKIEK